MAIFRVNTITVPTVGSATGFAVTQSYGYDSLNRLVSAAEMNGAQVWRQSYQYDRFGNRRIDTNTDQNGKRTTDNVGPQAVIGFQIATRSH